jgi:hypothetical protein
MFNFVIKSLTDPSGSNAANQIAIQKTLDGVAAQLNALFASTAISIDLDVTVDPSLSDFATAGGKYSLNSTGRTNALPFIAQEKIQLGIDSNGSSVADGSLRVSNAFIQALSDPAKTKLVTDALLHEMFHVLGYSGSLSSSTGLPIGQVMSVFDSHVHIVGVTPVFNGPATNLALGLALGGAVPLTDLGGSSSIYHIDDAADIMSQSVSDSKTVTVADLAILKDLGYAIRQTFISADGTRFMPGAGTTVTGKAGVDTAIFFGKSSDYTITNASDGSITVKEKANPAAWSVMTATERLQFSDTVLAYDGSGNAGEVYRLYQAAFNRKPDSAGLGFWIMARDGGTSMDSIATSFIASDEFKTLYGSNLTNDQFVTQIYSNVLHRAPDASGKAFWLKALDSNVSRAHVLNQFSASQENKINVMVDANGNEAKTYRLYQAAFDRAPDAKGLSDWATLMNSGARTLQTMAQDFIGSDEFTLKYGSNISDKQFVTQLYANVLHRAPDTAGQQFWESALAQGVARSSLLAQFSESPENRAQIVGVWQDGFDYTPYTG